MLGLHPLLARRHFLTSTVFGTVGVLLPLSAANAQSTPPSTPAPAETLTQAASVSSPTAGTAGTPFLAATEAAPAGDTSIRPFKYHATDEELADLKRRIKATKWPERETVADDTQGVNLATMQKLADYWANHHDWRRIEAKINSYPNFVTNIDGLDIHFIQVRSKHPNALPLIVTHGWPGSIIEQLKIIEPLTNPTAHGGTAADAFDVVIPSLPGYGFSGKPSAAGWGPERTAKAWDVLMKRLGYDRYVAQGGDWGSMVTDLLGAAAPPGLLGIANNMAAAIPPDIDAAAIAGKPAPAGLSDEEKQAYDHVAFFYAHGLGYANEMGNRPQTLYGLADSPTGLAAWIIDHDIWTYRQIVNLFNGGQEGLTRDDILDNITLYWLTNTAVSSARLYWENKNAFFGPKGVKVPAVVSAFPEEIAPIPKSWAEKAYPKLIYYKKHPKGAHFAAWENPEALVDDLREGFRSLR
ncbi:epoxide hydrolase 1 [Sphingomonas sp. SM33]|uniref:Epoxide hydrolase 1 n=1 Tax=Sphingomonas telluris TaxID=2907998 RepID=A0ABS9VIL2_9SPHN|nr:epoxide hydrolase [Sphingomonas telluris]MCH8614811.1 epoxide hydrolase 1 [Sphingomonas telluris]